MPADPVLHGTLPGARPDPIDHGQLDNRPQGPRLPRSRLVGQAHKRLAEEARGSSRCLRGVVEGDQHVVRLLRQAPDLCSTPA
eukprot:4299282-Alexandrium_andersonii.AAC.1